ncbi:MAG: hypothetical protein J0H12_04125 [Candidatus Paracaedimonas acanthamoebae]|jgi:hypothetical protein|uniref:Uncharacterized protein n=1 Tax=Candidatus Paracaedimonas acanthamoebae TaxID=244581 RepID=A0A8J7TUT5_9PROT|nr:hypothetical protein [Candidatus Paracaedimonas acanthamoebae]
MKKCKLLFIFLTLFSIEAWGGLLEISDGEMLNKNFGRILDNLEDFYSVNAAQIRILNEEKFYQNIMAPSSRAQKALIEIRSNEKASITENYSKKPRKLKAHLLELKTYFETLEIEDKPELKQQVTQILTYTKGLLLILKAIWR